MRYRKQSPSGDFLFGQGPLVYLVDNPDAVGQAIKTRLSLFKGEWFLNEDSGTPWNTEILGDNTIPLYDQAIQQIIVGTQGVLAIIDYASSLDQNRRLTVTAKVNTIYGTTSIQETI